MKSIILLFTLFGMSTFSQAETDALDNLRKPILQPQTKLYLQEVGSQVLHARQHERAELDREVEALRHSLEDLRNTVIHYLAIAARLRPVEDSETILQKNASLKSSTTNATQQKTARENVQTKLAALKSLRQIIVDTPINVFTAEKTQLLAQISQKLTTAENSISQALQEADQIKQLTQLTQWLNTYQLKTLEPTAPDEIAPSLMSVTELDE